MGDESLESNLIDALAEEFVERLRRGERPALSEYANRHPDLAHEIRDLFPALVTMEQARPGLSTITSRPGQGMLRASDGQQLDRLGDYRILREVGRGGMGIVYEAEQESLGRHVALKVLPRHALLDPRHLQRFQQEARAAARLHHTNIVPVFGVGEHDGLHYYVMQFIQGLGMDQVLVELARLRRHKKQPRSGAQPLSNSASITGSQFTLSAGRMAESLLSGEFQLPSDDPSNAAQTSEAVSTASSNLHVGLSTSDSSISSVQLPSADRQTSFSDTGRQYWHSVARIGVQVAEALAYAHAQGILHRDIKPSNLLLDTHGTVWVTDFGLAKASDSDDLTHTGDIVGTLRYLAPERLSGSSDQRSDLYSLGMTLYELLTLRPAFDETDRNQLVRQLTQQEPLRPRLIDAEIPLDLETIILKSIAKDPAHRYSSPSEMASDLRQFLDDKPIRARRVGVVEQTWRLCRRNPLVASLTSTILVLAIVLGVGALVVHLLRVERDSAIASKLRAEKAEGKARGLVHRAVAAEREVTIRQHLAQATALRRSGRIGQRFQCLDEIAAAMKLNPRAELRSDFRSEATAALGLTDLRVHIQRDAPRVLRGSCDPHMTCFAHVQDGTFDVFVRRMENDETILSIHPEGLQAWHADVELSSDGQLLAVAYWLSGAPNALLDVWSVTKQERIFRKSISSSSIEIAAAFHPNNRWLFYCEPGGQLCVWDLVDQRELQRCTLSIVPYSICVTNSGNFVAVNDRFDSVVKVLDLRTNEVVLQWQEYGGDLGMGWSDDERLLAVSDGKQICVWDMQRHQLMSVLYENPNTVNYLEFSPNGYLLATTGWDAATRLWDVVTGEQLVDVSGSFCRFSEDGRSLAFFDSPSEKVGIWEVAHADQRRILHPDMTGNRNLVETVAANDATFGIGGFALGKDGRLLINGCGSGVALWDANSGKAVARLNIGWCPALLLHPDEKYLLTWNRLGLLRWPIAWHDEPDGQSFTIGPPVRLLDVEASEYSHDLEWLPSFDKVALNDFHHRQVLLVDVQSGTPAAPFAVLPSDFPRVTNISVSADGKWIASGGHKEPGIQIWDVAQRKVVKVLAPRDEARDALFWVQFSPDNRWLVCESHDGDGRPIGYFFWSVPDWKRLRFIPAEPTGTLRCAFTRDGERAALSVAPNQMILIDVAEGREICRLSTDPLTRGSPFAFGPDAEKLVAITYPDTITIWNLRMLREQLAELTLDWNDAPFGPASHEKTIPILSAAANLGDAGDWLLQSQRSLQIKNRRSNIQHHRIAGRWQDLLSELEKLIELQPDEGRLHNELAWDLLVCPDQALRNPARALDHATRAVQLSPEDEMSRNTLGIAHFRAGNWQAAITELTKAEELKPGQWFAHNTFFIAMAKWQLGEKAAAQEMLHAVRRWMEEKQASLDAELLAELQSFQAEAEALIEGQ